MQKDYSIYCMAKSALVTMTKLLAQDLAPQVRVNAVAFGRICWPESLPRDAQAERQALAKTCLGRMGTPESLAEIIWFLLAKARETSGVVWQTSD